MKQLIVQFIIPFGYLFFILLLKKNLLDKIYTARKSSLIADICNSIVLLYFLFIKDMFLTLMFSFYLMTRYNSYRPNAAGKKKRG